jgi:hypothetical protein
MNLRNFLILPLLLLLSVGSALAIPLDVKDIATTDKTASITFTGANSGSGVFTEYTLVTNDLGNLTAFCVENALANDGISYELLPVPDDLYVPSLIADEFLNGGNSFGWTQEIAQIAIWETVFDTNYDLTGGTFKLFSGLTDTEKAIVNAIFVSIQAEEFSLTGPLALAHSPADGLVGGVASSQDYIVSASVPDASLVWLLSPALIALGVVGRRRRD